jgi:fatty acid-binding protein DegV
LLSPAAAGELGVELVSIPVTLDDEPFDGTVEAFYSRMRHGSVAKTSQPSPGAFVDAYERAESRGAASVLSLHLDRRISGVSESAALAARETAIPVRVVSLPTVSYGVGLCVRAACAALRGGASVNDAATDAERIAVTLDNVFVARSAPAGRVSADDEWTILRFAAGAAEALSAHASVEDASVLMGGRILRGRPGLVAVGHAGAEVEAAADRLAHDLVDAVAAVERYRVTPSVGAHTGPDSFGAFWWPA